MKTIIILAAIAFTHGAKLERAYLPPSHAGTSGGSANFLETPFSSPQSTKAIFNPNFGQSAQAEATHAQVGNQHDQFGNDNARYQGFGAQSNGFAQQQYEARPERARAALDRNAAIIRSNNQNDGETYSYAFETENGIYAEENGVATNGVEAQGGYSYTGDDGRVYSVRYTADQNGFVPQGDHLPTPPPIPEEILKALEQNARDEAAGIYDDGSYNEGKYSGNENQYGQAQNNYDQAQNQYGQPQNQFGQLQNQFGQPENQFSQSLNFNGDDDTIVTNAASARSSNLAQAGHSSRTSPKNAYLPPFAQRQRNTFGRRQSFDSRNGYRY